MEALNIRLEPLNIKLCFYILRSGIQPSSCDNVQRANGLAITKGAPQRNAMAFKVAVPPHPVTQFIRLISPVLWQIKLKF